uniref:G_PROTEIN_RECEP_F1_2 domain-containing protein n=1 Tax=Bursaphelenchus xylophilus TaxID=6326 RepID=A0A1I7RR17_BURXY
MGPMKKPEGILRREDFVGSDKESRGNERPALRQNVEFKSDAGPLAVLAFHDPSTILHDNVCTIRSQHYMIYGSILAFLIPFIIMTVTFTKTTQLLNKQASTLALKPVDGFNQGLRRTIMSKKRTAKTRQIGGASSASINGAESVNGTQRKGQRKGALEMSPLAKTSITNRQDSIKNKNISDSERKAQENEADPLIDQFKINNDNDDQYKESRKTISEKIQRRSTRITTQFNRFRNHLQIIRKKNQEITTSTELANEHKASRVLAVVFTCFFTCWTPFFIMNFTLGFCGSTCSVPPRIGSIILWLGYLSSTLNPVIYTIFNRRFREAFIKIIKCKCLSSGVENTYTRSQVYLATDPTWSCMEKSYQHKESVAALNGNNSLSTTTTLCVPNKNDQKQRHQLRTQHSHDEVTIQRRLSVDYPKTRRNSDTNSPQRTPSYISYRS